MYQNTLPTIGWNEPKAGIKIFNKSCSTERFIPTLFIFKHLRTYFWEAFFSSFYNIPSVVKPSQ